MSSSAKPTLSQTERNNEQLELARKAADNEISARKKVNELIEPVINYQSSRFCKRFCKENRSIFKCTLKQPIGSPPADAPFCEWGNGSYTWMLDDLASSKRLKKYQASNNASLFDYCYVIANSLPFYERWKDWRFGRKVYVPAYIQNLGKTAIAVFYGLRSQLSIEQISHDTGQSEEQTRLISREIVRQLSIRNKLHLLNADKNISLSQTDEDSANRLDSETASYDVDIDVSEDSRRLSGAWKNLNAIEQFVLEALVINEMDGEIVLNSLKKMNLSIKKGIPAEQTNRQQLYYFRRKTLAKLGNFLK